MTDDQKGLCCGLMLFSFVLGWILGWRTTTHVYQNEALKTQEGYYDSQTRAFKYKIVDEDSSM